MSAPDVGALDALPAHTLHEELMRCSGSEPWTRRMLEQRPFGSLGTLLAAADAAWDALDDDHWRSAYVAGSPHPLPPADDGTRNATVVALRLYEERFGYPFVIGTTDVGGDELLMRVRIRLGLEPDADLRAARYELRRLTRSRLERLVAGLDRGGSAAP